MRFPRLCLLAILTVAAPLAPVAAQVLTPYDVFVFGDFRLAFTEVNGRFAVGGNAFLSDFSVGRSLPSNFSDYSIVVGGNLTTTDGSVREGRTYVGGALTASGTNFPAAYPPQVGGTAPIDFLSESARLTAISNDYAAMEATGTTQLLSGELNFIGTSMYNIFSITIAMLQAGTAGYQFVTPVGATNIVNVLGSSSSSAFNNTAFYFDCTAIATSSSCVTGAQEETPRAAERTLFNFNEQSNLIIGGPVHGSILAPNAAVSFDFGDVVGTVVVRSAEAHAEFYSNHDFIGELPTTPIPEPASITLLGAGLIGIAGFARWKRAA